MARTKKVKEKETVVKKNPAIFTEVEALSYRKTLIQEIQWKAKGSLPLAEIESLADSVINKDEETTLWMRSKGMLHVSTFLLNQRNQQEGNVAS